MFLQHPSRVGPVARVGGRENGQTEGEQDGEGLGGSMFVDDQSDAAGEEFPGGLIGIEFNEFHGGGEVMRAQEEAVVVKLSIPEAELVVIPDGVEIGASGLVWGERVVVAIQ